MDHTIYLIVFASSRLKQATIVQLCGPNHLLSIINIINLLSEKSKASKIVLMFFLRPFETKQETGNHFYNAHSSL